MRTWFFSGAAALGLAGAASGGSVLAAPITAGESFQIESTSLGETRDVFVHLPQSYARTDFGYPVVCLLDGEWNFLAGAGTADRLAMANAVVEVILISVPNTERTRDMTPVVDPREPESGGGEAFLRFLGDELLPAVEARYRTAPGRVLAGHSRAGLFTIHAFLSGAPFDAFVSISPNPAWNDGWITTEIERMRFGAALDGRLVYVSVGESEQSADGIAACVELLRDRLGTGVEVVHDVLPGEDHDTVVVPSFGRGLRAAFPQRQIHETLMDAFETGGLATFRAAFTAEEERLGPRFVVAERTLNTIGYEILEADPKAAIELFRLNVVRFPQKSNVYDSLGEALELAGRLDEAREAYAKAVEKARAHGSVLLEVFEENLARVTRQIEQG